MQIEALEESLREKAALLADKEAVVGEQETRLREQENRCAEAAALVEQFRAYALRKLELKTRGCLARHSLRRGLAGLRRAVWYHKLELALAPMKQAVQQLERQLADKHDLTTQQETQLQDLQQSLQKAASQQPPARPAAPPRRVKRRASSGGWGTSFCMFIISLVMCALSAQYVVFLGRGSFCSIDNERLTG